MAELATKMTQLGRSCPPAGANERFLEPLWFQSAASGSLNSGLRARQGIMTGKIFVNYRRGDEAGFTTALYQRLEDEFASGDLFMDVEGHIKPGDDFSKVLNAQVAAADMLLVVIGPRWADLLAARQGDPRRFRRNRDQGGARPRQARDPGAGRRRRLADAPTRCLRRSDRSPFATPWVSGPNGSRPTARVLSTR